MSAPASGLAYDPVRVLGDPDPYPLYRRLRDEAPVYRSDEGDFWALSRFEDVEFALRNAEVFSSAGSVAPDRLAKRLRLNSFQDMDPPHHDVLRRIVRRHFTPDGVKRLEPAIAGTVNGLLDRFVKAGGGDMAADLAWVLPLRVVGMILGVDLEEQEFLRGCFHGIFHANLHSIDGVTPDVDGMQVAAEQMRSFFLEKVVDRARQTDGSVIRTLGEAGEAREAEHYELAEICMLVFFAGFETTANLLSSAILLLAEHPDQRALLISAPEMTGAAVEEFVRFDTPVQVLARDTTRPAELHGHQIPADARVLLIFGAANRDERRFPEPDRLDVSREPLRHLGFGNGIHHCLGAPIARLESRIALEQLLSCMPEYRLDGAVERSTNMVATRGVASLPVAC